MNSCPTRTPGGKGTRECLIRSDVRQHLDLPDALFHLQARLRPGIPEGPRLLEDRWPLLQAPFPGRFLIWGTVIWHEACHLIMRDWFERHQPFAGVWKGLAQDLKSRRDELLTGVLRHFSPTPVFRSQLDPSSFLKRYPQVSLEEGLLVWLASQNPALARMKPVLSDKNLLEECPDYPELAHWIEGHPGPRTSGLTLIDQLLEPIRRHPLDLGLQIQILDRSLGGTLSAVFPELWNLWTDLLKEVAPHTNDGSPPPPPPLTTVYPGHTVGVRYSIDTDWMPRLTLMAKNTPVWLNQLSERYGRPIDSLADIPDQELDTMADWGITGLWLIGLWTRSRASRRIKQLCGQEEAEASAYALHEYTISPHLGGETALENLRDRALARGIRLAADMVPNHMGLDAPLVMEHPDLFLQTPVPPFPNYRFSGENLSGVPDREIRTEDGYYSRSDAAVVFSYTHNSTGQTRYIYHGNDGTSMPWNDTAQLNFLLPETRRVVMDQILKVARLFPVVRFDAAMTLTRFHYQRLWFPLPGQGGDIPSRAGLIQDAETFDRAMPKEFWREVVDTLARETPDTLLLAEAFWMMEPYFVRHLGMHRVYHSAFMHAMLSEHNAPFRASLKGMLREDPRLLTRFVHFLSNPDEASALSQFGDGDRYFSAVCLQVTLPGLPMLAHGQIEGLSEKYGMDFSRPLWREPIRHDLVDRHRKWVVPLLRERYLYAGTRHFTFFSLRTEQGHEAPHVYAFINGTDRERRLVLVNHASHGIRGCLVGPDPQAHPVLAESFDWTGALLPGQRVDTPWILARDQRSGEDHLLCRDTLDSRGLPCELNPYETVVLGPFHPVQDEDGALAALYPDLAPVPHQGIRHHLGELRKSLIWNALENLWKDIWAESDPDHSLWLAWVQMAESWPEPSHPRGPARTARVLETLRQISPDLFRALFRWQRKQSVPSLERWVWNPDSGQDVPSSQDQDAWILLLIQNDPGPLGILRHVGAWRRFRHKARKRRQSRPSRSRM